MDKKDIPNDYYKMYEDRYQRVYDHGLEVWGKNVISSELDIFVEKANINKNMSGIDIGCGEGVNTIYLAKKGLKITGVDFSKTGLDTARKLAKKENVEIDFIQDDALVLSNFKDDSFDFGICSGCLHMLVTQSDRNKLLKQIKRVLKADGIFFLLNRGDGAKDEYPDVENIYEDREWIWVDKDGKRLDAIKLPHLPSWPRSWENHLKEIDHGGFEVVHKFNSINKSFSDSMCVILKPKI